MADKTKDSKSHPLRKTLEKKNFFKTTFSRERPCTPDVNEMATPSLNQQKPLVIKPTSSVMAAVSPASGKEPSSNQLKPVTPISRWIDNIIANKGFRVLFKEFIANKNAKPAEFTTEFCNKNEPKNRYNDVLCTDRSRVILKDRPTNDDYIHGSWMDMPDKRKYISTQGPLPETIIDFWHMIFTEKSTVIVMLCDYYEENKEKCSRYFNKNKDIPEKYGPYKVVLKEDKADPIENIKYNVLEVEKGGVRILVHHLANHKWSDHIVPEKPGPIVHLMKLAKKLSENRPITVHCSAGIGRTATFVGIDYASQRVTRQHDVVMLDIFREMRAMRFHAIQSVLQYIFLHICVLEFFVEENQYPRSKLFEEYVDDCVKSSIKCVNHMRKKTKGKKKEEE